MLIGVELIAGERERQVSEEGWTAEHDDSHIRGELAMAGACYAAPSQIFSKEESADGICFLDPWPFDHHWDKRERFLCWG